MALKKYHKSNNVFMGTYSGFVFTSVSEDATKYNVNTSTNAKTAVIAVQPNTEYTIHKVDTSNRFQVGETPTIPTSSGTLINRIRVEADDVVTFTTRSDTNYIMVYVSTSTEAATPRLMCNLGATALDYEDYYAPYWEDTPYRRYETATDAVTTLPVEIFTDGQPVSSYTIKGNTQTSGTPSPQNPVTVDGVGNETANLTDINNGTGTQTNDYYADMVLSSANKQKLIDQINGIQGEKWLNFTVDNDSYRANIYVTYQNTGGVDYRNPPFHLKSNDTVTNIIIRARSDNASLRGTVVSFDNIMLNTGESAIPFEPYGLYKISILKDLQPLTPIYLSQPLRKSLDGTAFDTLDSTGLVTYNVDEYGQPQTATTETVAVPTITTTGGAVTLDVDTTIKPSEMSLTYHGWHEHEPLKYNNGSWS